MKTQLILLDIPVIVSDEEILNNDLCLYLGRFDANILCKAVDTETGRVYQELNIKPIEEYGSTDGGITPLKSEIFKIIAGIEGLPSINWNGLEKEFGWVDVDKLAKELDKTKYRNFRREYTLKETYEGIEDGFIEGFKKAQSLNKKKFSLEDMVDAVNMAKYEDMHGDDIIQSLQQPKVFDIEIEITNNSIKILRKV